MQTAINLVWSRLVRLMWPCHPVSLWCPKEAAKPLAEGRRRGKLCTLSITELQNTRQSQAGRARPRVMIFISHSPCLFQLER